jgi:hypothetical protein
VIVHRLWLFAEYLLHNIDHCLLRYLPICTLFTTFAPIVSFFNVRISTRTIWSVSSLCNRFTDTAYGSPIRTTLGAIIRYVPALQCKLKLIDWCVLRLTGVAD